MRCRAPFGLGGGRVTLEAVGDGGAKLHRGDDR
jgi:hypothetical protein